MVLSLVGFAAAVWRIYLLDIASGVLLVAVTSLLCFIGLGVMPHRRKRRNYQVRYGGSTASLSTLVDVDEIRRVRDEQGIVHAARSIRRHHPDIPLKDLADWVRSL